MADDQGIDGAFRHILDAITASSRWTSTRTARFGGDEFVIIGGLATQDDLTVYGRRLVRLIHDSRFAPTEDVGLRVTVSGGGSLVAVGDPDEHAALGCTDAAMYAAKRRGRDEFETGGNGSGR